MVGLCVVCNTRLLGCGRANCACLSYRLSDLEAIEGLELLAFLAGSVLAFLTKQPDL